MQSKWYICDSVQADPEGTSKLHEDMAQMPVIPSAAPLPSLVGSSTQSVDTEETVLSGFQMILQAYRHHPHRTATSGAF